MLIFFFFFFNDTATTEIYTLSLHDALPIFRGLSPWRSRPCHLDVSARDAAVASSRTLQHGTPALRCASWKDNAVSRDHHLGLCRTDSPADARGSRCFVGRLLSREPRF